MQRRLIPFVLCASLLAGCQPPVVEAVVTPPPPAEAERGRTLGNAQPGLTVQGTATLQVEPDVADVRMELSATAKTPQAAAKALRVKQESMRANLLAQEVDDEDLTVSTLVLQPQHRWNQHTNVQEVIGYQASLSVVACTDTFDRVPAIVEAGARAGVTSSSTSFRSTKMPELKRQVRAKAIVAAQAKAAQFAEALDIGEMTVVMVNESEGGEAWTTYGFGRSTPVANVAMGGAGEPWAPVRAAALPLTLTVTVGYALG